MKEQEMVEKNELISRYQNKFADKTLSLGCKMKHIEGEIYNSCSGRDCVFLRFNRHLLSSKSRIIMITTVDNDVFDEDKLKIIGHPLNYGLLYQEVLFRFQNDPDAYGEIPKIISNLEGELCNIGLLGNTIYEWIENERVKEILTDLKNLIEK